MSVPSEDERLWMVYAEVPMGQFDGDYLRWRAREVALISTPICWSCFKADSCRTDRWACSATQRLMPTCGRGGHHGRRQAMRVPDPDILYPDGEVIFSTAFPDSVGVWVATNLLDGGDIDPIPIRIRVTTEDGTGSAYLTAQDAYELVQALGNAITKAKRIEAEHRPPPPASTESSRP